MVRRPGDRIGDRIGAIVVPSPSWQCAIEGRIGCGARRPWHEAGDWATVTQLAHDAVTKAAEIRAA